MTKYLLLMAMSCLLGVLAKIHESPVFLIGWLLWLGYLYHRKRVSPLNTILAVVTFCFYFSYIPSIEAGSPTKTSPNVQQKFIGKITSSPTITDTKFEFTIHDPKKEERILVIYFRKNDDTALVKHYRNHIAYGATCHVEGARNNRDYARNPGQFNYQNYLHANGLSYQLVVDSLDTIQCQGHSFLNTIYKIRFFLQDVLENRFHKETAAWMQALILGNSAYLEPLTVELFRDWHIAHILAISGLHVGLIAMIIYGFLVYTCQITKEKAESFVMFSLPVYAILAGGAPSVWRACLMMMGAFLFKKLKIQVTSFDMLLMLFLLFIIMNPFIVYHIGFQFSFAVTFGIIISQRWFFHHNRSFIGLKLSFIAQMIILPLQFIYFHTFNPLSIILNFIIVPYFTMFVIPYLLIGLFLLPFPHFVLNLYDFVFMFIHKTFISMIESIDKVVEPTFLIGDFPLFFVFLFYGSLLWMMICLEKRKWRRAFTFGTLISIVLIVLCLRPYFSSVGTITMLDIGQGDAFVIELPYRRGVFMIDVGATYSFDDFTASDRNYAHIIKPYLQSRGIQTIDAIFITHQDIDHAGSLPYIVNDFTVNNVYFSAPDPFHPEFEKDMTERGAQLIPLNAPELIYIKKHPIYILSPREDYLSSNDNSLVIYSKFGPFTWLFTGDIGHDVEKSLLDHYPTLKADVLKVAHHGSATSTDQSLIETIRPSFALISVGENNRYNHPDEGVIDRLEAEDITILRTDWHGAVQFRFQTKSGTFFKYLP